MRKRIQWLITICASVAMLGCTTLQPLALDSKQLSTTLNRGDQVVVTTTEGRQLQFKIDKIDEQGLHGDGQNVAYSDIRSIDRKQVSAGRTALLVLALVAGGALAAGGGGGGSGSGY